MTDTTVVRARLDFSYDGTDFSGWAAQPNLRTVEGALEEAVNILVRTPERARVTVAGRTDAGVHARGQVAHVDIPEQVWRRLPGRSDRPSEVALRDRLSGLLPSDIAIIRVRAVPEGFDARFSAMERRYAYRVSDRPSTRDPLHRRWVLWNSKPLDVDALCAASATLEGLRDFAPFCKPREGATTIRELTEFSWQRVTEGADAGLVVATVRADAFCHSMVRSLVGAVLTVGEGRRDLSWLARLAAEGKRTSAVHVAPAHGLTLESVAYPADADAAARADANRRRRTLD